MPGFLRPKKRRVFVLGLDGVPYTLLKHFAESGVMPNFASLLREGASASMEASLPEVSSTAWVTFMTGVNPGRHGIYGFMDFKPGNYDIYFPRSQDIKSPTIWDMFGKHGKRSVVLNIPSTYPAQPLNGVLTAGFVALDLAKATYPPAAFNYLQRIGYRMDVDYEKACDDVEAFTKDIDAAFEKREEAFKHFLSQGEWDFFVAVVTETDRLHHFFFEGFLEPRHPLHGYLLDFYRKIDALAGVLYRKVRRDDTLFMVVSDHGFAAIKQEIYINSWLREKGYLSFKKTSPESFNDVEPASRAFALDPSRVYIHRKGRFPFGSVVDADYETVRRRLREELLAFELNGERVVKNVFLKEEIYSGPHVAAAPDLVILSHDGFDLKGTLRKNDICGRSSFTGAHTRGNAVFFVDKKGPFAMDNINIADVAPTILDFMGLSEEALLLDGKVIFHK